MKLCACKFSVILLFTSFMFVSFAQSEWTWRNPVPQGNYLRSVVWSGSLLVAVGDAGTILTSPDGNNWKIRFSGTTVDLESVVWNGSKFVAVGYGIACTSSDGTTWASHSTASENYLNSVTWTGSQFVAVGGLNQIQTSPDGITWTDRSSGITGGPLSFLNSVTWTGSQLVAVGSNVYISSDGITWNPSILDTGGNSVIWADSQLVIVGGYGIITSKNGVDWTNRNSGTTASLGFVTWTGKMFVAIGGNTMCTSPDGVTWTSSTISGADMVFSVVWASNQFVAVCKDGDILTSTDGSSWISHRQGRLLNYYSIIWTGSKFIAVGDSGVISTSTTGIEWNSWFTGTISSLMDIVCNGVQSVAVGVNGEIYSSADGSNWAQHTSGTHRTLYSVIWTGDKFMAFGGDTICASPDGNIWSSRASGSADFIGSALWTGTQFVAVAASIYARMAPPFILTSPDASTWTERYSFTTLNIYSMVWTGNQVVAIDNNHAYISKDCISWSTQNLGNAKPLNYLIWKDNQFFALGSGSLGGAFYFCTSSDGFNWINYSMGTSTVLRSIAVSNDQFVVVGDEGSILTSKADNSGVVFHPSKKPTNASGIKIHITKNRISVMIPDEINNKKLNVGIFTVSGNRCYSSTIKTHDGILNIPADRFPTGKYFLSITDDTQKTLISAFVLTR